MRVRTDKVKALDLVVFRPRSEAQRVEKRVGEAEERTSVEVEFRSPAHGGIDPLVHKPVAQVFSTGAGFDGVDDTLADRVDQFIPVAHPVGEMADGHDHNHRVPSLRCRVGIDATGNIHVEERMRWDEVVHEDGLEALGVLLWQEDIVRLELLDGLVKGPVE